jgi:hypothetical protein
MRDQWRAFFKSLQSYFKAYGGFRGILKSPLFIIALMMAILNYSVWENSNVWVEKSEVLIPSLLGFSLGTYAILFSLISLRLKGALRKVKSSSGISYLHSINATFFHFIFVQTIALSWSFLYSGSWLSDLVHLMPDKWSGFAKTFYYIRNIGSFFGYLLLVYSFLLVIGAAQAIYRLALIRDPSEDSVASSSINEQH